MLTPDPTPLAGVGIALHYTVAAISTCAQALKERGVVFREGADGSLVVGAADCVGCVTVFEPASG
jgi:hypothetical protein